MKMETRKIKFGLKGATESGQTTAEYALIILGAATLATLFLAWVGETNRIGRLFDAIIRSVDGLIP